MKTSAFAAGLLTMVFSVPAGATVLFDTTHALSTANSTRLEWPNTGSSGAVPRGGPIGMSFYAPSATTVTDVQLQLTANNPSDGGSVLIFLVPDVGTGATGSAVNPTFTGTGPSLAFTGATQIGSIADSLLPSTTSGSLFKFNTNTPIASGEYWLAAENTLGTGGIASTAKWVFDSTPYTTGTGTANQLVFWQAGQPPVTPGTPATFSDTLFSTVATTPGENNLYLAVVDAPEPMSLALLGVGLAGIGIARRRRQAT